MKNIFDDEELDKNSVCAKIAHTASDGKNYKTTFYNLNRIVEAFLNVVECRALNEIATTMK